MSNKLSYTGTPLKYINDFSKELASEVSILLREVGKLRDERRALQFEIAELMAVKSRYGAGGEYYPDWKLRDPPGPSALASMPPAEEPASSRPAWRTVNREPFVHKKDLVPKPLPLPAPAPPPMDTRTHLSWQPNPSWAPTPPGSFALLPSLKSWPPPAPAPPSAEARSIASWATWQPNPQWAPTPPAAITSLPPSLGLFGPRSPRASPPPRPQGLFGPRSPRPHEITLL